MDKISILPSEGEHDDAPVLLNGEPLGSHIVPYETDTKNDSTASESKIFIETRVAEKAKKYFGYEEGSDIDELFDLVSLEQKNSITHSTVHASIQTEIQKTELTPQEKERLDKCIDFAISVTASFKSDFLFLLEQYNKQHPVLTEQIYKYAREHDGFSLPEFKILDSKSAEKFMDSFGWQGSRPAEGEFLLVFQLPKFLANFWWKSGRTSSEKRPANQHSQIDWGDFYYGLIPIVWGEIEEYEYEHNLRLRRINDIGQHDQKNYYYMWSV